MVWSYRYHGRRLPSPDHPLDLASTHMPLDQSCSLWWTLLDRKKQRNRQSFSQNKMRVCARPMLCSWEIIFTVLSWIYLYLLYLCWRTKHRLKVLSSCKKNQSRFRYNIVSTLNHFVFIFVHCYYSTAVVRFTLPFLLLWITFTLNEKKKCYTVAVAFRVPALYKAKRNILNVFCCPILDTCGCNIPMLSYSPHIFLTKHWADG